MEILGIGPSELLFIVVLALIILGPKDMQKAGRTLGRWLRQVVTSDGWKFFQQTSREIQTLPNRLMREAALEELKDMEKDLGRPMEPGSTADASRRGHTAGSPAASSPEPENTILPSPPSPSRQPGETDTDA
jgi:sec-independent protein translocase protein TatB